MSATLEKLGRRKRRKQSIRQKIRGTSTKPRLTVYRSKTNIYAQIIDDESQKTVCAASTQDKSLKEELKNANRCTVDNAKKVGKLLSKRAKEAKVKEIIFDRNGYKYHGRIKALADACREHGLIF